MAQNEDLGRITGYPGVARAVHQPLLGEDTTLRVNASMRLCSVGLDSARSQRPSHKPET